MRKPKEVNGIPQHYHWFKIRRCKLFWWWPFITKSKQQDRWWKNIAWLGLEVQIRYR